ncbi:MAG: SMI1/KNR4 family protein [Lachnospiraceae bacterium]|nr:SMI1/KNR4 family protein [Lachnospiraceae bacterium]
MNGELYIKKLKEAYEKRGLADKWNHVFDIAHGISKEDKELLLKEYPEFPSSLMEILEMIDGTYWRQYRDEEVTHYFFGSDVDDGEYPYYLCSAKDIMDNKDSASNFGDLFYYFLEEFDEDFGPFIDDKIQMDADKLKWLNFSDCMNNGGTSSLFVDFTPSEKGTKGQIVRYLHDPDELKVIADSFDEFLEMLIENDFRFIHEDD